MNPSDFALSPALAGASIARVVEGGEEGNVRFVVRLADGAEVESVLYRGDTLCVSSQVGCGVRCPFCASGAFGVARNLSVDELFAQRALVQAYCAERGLTLARVTVSGAGEPLHNHDAVAAFVDAVASSTPATLTTTGAPLAKLATWLSATAPHHNGLTLSIHAGTEATRAKLVPKGPPLDALFALLSSAVPTLSRRRRKKLALAYLCIAGENDHDDELDAFAARARPLGLRVHLYAHNAVPTSPLHGPSRARYEAIYAHLVARGLSVHMSSRARLESNGGCGTLVALRRSALVPSG